ANLQHQNIAAAEGSAVPGERSTADLAGDIGPGRAAVDRALDDIARAQRAAEGGGDDLAGGVGDEVGIADAGIGEQLQVAEDDGGRRG
ncbi:hypothetical protein KKI91_23140, partial [Xenorhabdus bovienii]|uniref:hypothetical protein n=1 Tax=Xenorhabdus bovienii TaxID=40576 RepID=UPI0023B351B2